MAFQGITYTLRTMAAPHTTSKCCMTMQNRSDILTRRVMPLVDLIVGTAMIVIGALALHGVIPIGGSAAFITLGVAEVIGSFVPRCVQCCQNNGYPSKVRDIGAQCFSGSESRVGSCLFKCFDRGRS